MAKCGEVIGFKAIFLLFTYTEYFFEYASVSGIGFGHSSLLREFYDHESVIPDIGSHSRAKRDVASFIYYPDAISIKFGAFRKGFIIDLHKNRELFSSSYIEKHFTSNGSEVIHKKHKSSHDHCNYHGTVRGIKQSTVVVSICDGINGYVDAVDDIYYIHRDERYTNNTHLVFRESDMIPRNSKCGVDGTSVHLNKVHRRLRRSVRGPFDETPDTRYVELYIVNDYRQFVALNRDLHKTNQRAIDIINVVNALYRPLGIYIALVGIETWTNGDRIVVSTEAENTMNNFLVYRRTNINPIHRNDNAQLLTGNVFKDAVVGKAVKGPICTFKFSGGVNMDHHGSLGPVSTTVAHEMGHNFGMEHDTGECNCPDIRCVMAPTSGSSSPRHWSSCSKQFLADAFYVGMDYCLKNKPDTLSYSPNCGNGFVEAGEECDCGTEELCNNNCCNATTCRLQPGAECATGKCCNKNNCKFLPISTVCRGVNNECDLPEYCNGVDEYCPGDFLKENGTPCQEGQAFCYKGACPTYDKQCKFLWGSTGNVADDVCFNLNKEGQDLGNCGYDVTKGTNGYSKCKHEDIMCGMLHCNHRHEKLAFWKRTFTHQTPETELRVGRKTVICKSVILDVGLDMPDPGMTFSGTKCGKKKMCVNHKCLSLMSLNYTMCPSNCSNHGFCNNKGHCHCDAGYGPPYCNGAGNGGSFDSGPAGLSGSKALLIGLLVLFLLIIPVLGLFGFFVYRNREALKRGWHQRSRKYLSRPASTNTTLGVNHDKRKLGARPMSKSGREISSPVFQSSTIDQNKRAFDNPHIDPSANYGVSRSAHIPDISHPIPSRTAPRPPPNKQPLRPPSASEKRHNPQQRHSMNINKPERPPPIKHLQGNDIPAYQNIPRPPRKLIKSGHMSLNLDNLPETVLNHDTTVSEPVKPPRPPRVQSLNFKNNISRVEEIRKKFGAAPDVDYENTKPSVPKKPKNLYRDHTDC